MERIQECAATICKALAGIGEINILRLAEYVGERSVIAYQALGWLAHEGKIYYDHKGGQVFVLLNEEEQPPKGKSQ